jgi:hypothetical protein
MKPRHSREALVASRKSLMDYLLQKHQQEDWHGVADAAMDLREIDAKLELLDDVGSTPTLPGAS